MDPQVPIQNQIPNDKSQITNGAHNITVLSMAVFVLFALGAIAFLYYQNQQLKKMLANYQTPTASPTPSATVDPTANWKTYTNKKYGFEFRYPSDWTDLTNTPEDVLFYKSIDDQVRFVVKKSTSINQLIQELGIKNQENITFNDVKFTKISYYTKQAGNIIEYVIAKNNNLLIFSDNTQILSTFKFLENGASISPNASCQYNGKTYKSGESVPSADKCNSCSCANGQIACTSMACE